MACSAWQRMQAGGMRRLMLAALVVTGVAAGMARAEGPAPTLVVPLVQTAEPIRHSYPGRVLAVGGIELGMTAGEVRAKLAGLGGSVSEDMDSQPLTLREGGRTAIAARYLLQISSSRPDSLTVVGFGLPSTGSRVVWVGHLMRFGTGQARPSVQALLDQMTAAYGPESVEARILISSVMLAFWAYDEVGPKPCGPRGCPPSSEHMDAGAMQRSFDLLLMGLQLGITVSFRNGNDQDWPAWQGNAPDLSDLPAGQAFVKIYDDANVALTVAQGLQQLRAALVASPGHTAPKGTP